MFPHPLVRLLLLILLAASLPALDLRALTILLLTLLLAALRAPGADWRRLLRTSFRLRWLLVSIVVLHLGFAPDRVAVFGGALWLPGPAAAQAAAAQALLLVVLLAGVELLRATTPAQHVAAALVRLLQPARPFGVRPGRFARRLAMTLEAVPRTGDMLKAFSRDRSLRSRSLAGWAEAAAALVRDTERAARAEGPEDASQLPVLPPLRGRDWLVLGAGAAALALLGAA